MAGLRVFPNLTLDDLKPTRSGMLILPGGKAWGKKKNKGTALLAADFFGQRISSSCDLRSHCGVGAHRSAG